MKDVPESDAAAEPNKMADEPAPRRARVSRWDRPKEPHDWRWVVGHIGRALIVLGLLMFGFVAYQLWGTGLETARAQNGLDHEFDNYIEQAGITPDTIGPATISTIPPSTSPPVNSQPGTATTAPLPPTTTVSTVVQQYPDIDPGDAIARLKIARIGIDYKVVAGVNVKDLKKGPGHFPNTPLPGQLGNAAIAGHRTGHGGPFGDLDQLRPGDEIEVYTAIGGAYLYVVTDSFVVGPQDYHVVTDSDPNVATLTLITCTPKFTSDQRLVVRATLDPQRSSDVGSPELFYGQQETPVESTLPADDTLAPVVVETLPAAVSGSAGTAATTTPAVSSTTSASETTAPPPVTDAPGGDVSGPSAFDVNDAFSQGWFDDTAAVPHVLFWAALLGLVVFGSYQLAKRFRRLWLGILVGFVPFVVVLYFFYENVNRLLPAAI